MQDKSLTERVSTESKPHVRKIDLVRTPTTAQGYMLPFPREHGLVPISQGFHGRHSHFAKEVGLYRLVVDDSYALDFSLPLGTAVTAAKEGKVLAIVTNDDSYYEGLNPEIGLSMRTNYILLEHDDGFCTLYSHLAKDSSVVRRGDEVKCGDVLAYTGKSGWIGGIPHLHFEVCTVVTRQMDGMRVGRMSYPVTFDN